ncbi:unnamed protein product [Xylocopa violacea]|uniref:Uncharacterized protein n=1 Tax=Xylocopa violacea TaxID=135666 RepID=A0ABP1PCI9_XYLVO
MISISLTLAWISSALVDYKRRINDSESIIDETFAVRCVRQWDSIGSTLMYPDYTMVHLGVPSCDYEVQFTRISYMRLICAL